MAPGALLPLTGREILQQCLTHREFSGHGPSHQQRKRLLLAKGLNFFIKIYRNPVPFH
mgnify:CR=1 FL=1